MSVSISHSYLIDDFVIKISFSNIFSPILHSLTKNIKLSCGVLPLREVLAYKPNSSDHFGGDLGYSVFGSAELCGAKLYIASNQSP